MSHNSKLKKVVDNVDKIAELNKIEKGFDPAEGAKVSTINVPKPRTFTSKDAQDFHHKYASIRFGIIND